jgi:hypothetical protein
MGAAFYGASLAPGFRVKDFKVKDITPFGIDVVVRAIMFLYIYYIYVLFLFPSL